MLRTVTLRRFLPALAGVFAIALLAPTGSAELIDPNDPIVGIQSAQNCQHYALPIGTMTTGGVFCASNDSSSTTGFGFSLTNILNGTIQLPVNNSQTPSYNILNDTGAALTSLTLYYYGALASNAFIDMQQRNPFLSSNWGCTSVDANGVTHYAANCGTGDITAVNPPLPLKLTWAMPATGGTAFPADGTFNLWTASFAHAGQDAGYFSGPPSVPDGGSTVMMLGGALLVVEALRRAIRA